METDLAYRTVQHVVSLVSAFLDVTLKRRGIKWLKQLKAAKKFRRDRHDSTPVVKLAAVLSYVISISQVE